MALLSLWIERFLGRCLIEGKAERTVDAYRETLRRFERSVGDRPITEVEPDHIYDYMSQFLDLTPETRHRYFREPRRFFNWLVETGELERSPFAGMRNIRLPQRLIRPFAPGDIEALLAITADSPMGARDRAIVLTFLDTGVRCSELANIDVEHLDLEARRIRILHAKAGKQRVVPFADRCATALDEYLRDRGRQPGPLFVAALANGQLRRDRRLLTNGVKQLLRRLGRRAGVPKVFAHRFRHSYATWAIQNNARELDVQHLLGHSSGDMVRRYSAAYRSEQAALRHPSFSPADMMLTAVPHRS